MCPPIFISYRRNPSVEFARTVHYALAKLNIDSFFDYTSCRDGYFNEKIYEAIDGCRYVFLIMMDGALDAIADNEDDWVRKELEYALSKGKSIVPIVMSGHQRKWPDRLPPLLEKLATLQISKLDNEELFEASLLQILRERTDLLLSGPASSDNQLRNGCINLGDVMYLGFQIARFCFGYLRKQQNASDIDKWKYYLSGFVLPFISPEQLSVANMMSYLENCAQLVSKVTGVDKARYFMAFGALYYFAGVSRVSNLGSDLAHSYDSALVSAGVDAGFDPDLLMKIARTDGDIMEYFDEARSQAELMA